VHRGHQKVRAEEVLVGPVQLSGNPGYSRRRARTTGRPERAPSSASPYRYGKSWRWSRAYLREVALVAADVHRSTGVRERYLKPRWSLMIGFRAP
jgi:hypothetical protein